MRTKRFLLTLLFSIQGCTVFGIAIDSKFPAKNPDENIESFTESGIKADIELVKSVIYDEPLPGNESNRLVGCKGLIGKKQVECYKVSNQLSEFYH